MTGIGRLLAPRSIAIVGLSADATKHGRRVLNNLRSLGYAGEVWGVNPSCPEVSDVAVFATLAELPGVPDVIVSAVPAQHVSSVVRDAGAVGAGAVIVFAGGFAEAGEPGGSLQSDLSRAILETGVRVLGPNSGGVIVPSNGLAMSFLTCLDRPAEQIRSGGVGLVTQSGGTGSYIHNLAAAKGGGLAASISTGNEVDVGVADGIAALTDLDEVRAIGVVLETVRDGPAFLAAVRRAHNAGKRVVVVRIGRSDRGHRLMQTHTGAMARPSRVVEGVLSSLGVAVAETPEEMFEIAEILARTPPPAGRRAGVVTHSGGIAILLSDLAAGTPIELPVPGPALRSVLEPLLQQGSADNPLDMGGIIGGPQRFGEVVDAVARSGDVDLVLAVSTAHPPAHTAARVDSLLALSTPVPVVHLWMGGDVAAHGLAALRESGAPVTEEPRAAMRALAALVEPTLGQAAPAVDSTSDQSPVLATPMTEHATKQLVESWGFATVAGEIATTADMAISIANRLGFPVVLKISSADIVHKTEVGGVAIGLTDAQAVASAFDDVMAAVRAAEPDASIDGVLVERCVNGPEVILGALHDETFGPMVLVGLGGVVAEALDDARMALAPLGLTHARQMIDSLAGLRVLTNPRVGQPADLDALATLLVLLGDRVGADPSIGSIDLNPIVWSGSQWLVLDAAIEVGERGLSPHPLLDRSTIPRT